MSFATRASKLLAYITIGVAVTAGVALGATPVSAASSTPVLSIDGGRAVVTLNPTLSDALLMAGVAISATGPATAGIITRSGEPAVRVTYPVNSGAVEGTGRVRINVAGGTAYTSPTVGTFVTSTPRFIIDPQGNGEVTVRIRHQGRTQGATLDLTDAVIVVVNAHVRIAKVGFVLNSASAAVYNLLAGTNSFTAGQTVATVNIRIHIA